FDQLPLQLPAAGEAKAAPNALPAELQSWLSDSALDSLDRNVGVPGEAGMAEKEGRVRREV
ncbi:MAG: hypothetical protein AB2710_14935, partial [Candidatus Thiodiazotropha sp.]